MTYNMYVLFDIVKNEFGTINLYKNDLEALRAMDIAMKSLSQMDNPTARAEDFKLFCLGNVNIETMEMEPKTPELIEYTLKLKLED